MGIQLCCLLGKSYLSKVVRVSCVPCLHKLASVILDHRSKVEVICSVLNLPGKFKSHPLPEFGCHASVPNTYSS